MGDPYTSVSVNNYNLNAPADDATQVPSNQLSWAKHKTKLTDPLKTALESIDTNIGAAVDALVGGAGVNSQAAGYTTQASDQGKLVSITSAGTLNLIAAATAGSPFVHGILNSSSGTLTVDPNGSETIDGQTTITLPAGAGLIIFTDSSNWFTTGRGNTQGVASFVTPMPHGYISGLQLSKSAADTVGISAGACRAATAGTTTPNNSNIEFTTAWTKLLTPGTWTAGTGNAGLSSSLTYSTSTWYHVFAILVGGSADIGFDTSVTAANLVTDHSATDFRRLGSIRTDSGPDITAFTQAGDIFLLTTPTDEFRETITGTETKTITTPPGVKCVALCNFGQDTGSTAGGVAYVHSPDVTDGTSSTNAAPYATVGMSDVTPGGGWGYVEVLTDTSSQIDIQGAGTCMLSVLGWRDFRGTQD